MIAGLTVIGAPAGLQHMMMFVAPSQVWDVSVQGGCLIFVVCWLAPAGRYHAFMLHMKLPVSGIYNSVV
jgi:hypothetical protein